MRKLDLEKSSTVVAGGCEGLRRRARGQEAKGHVRRAIRMWNRYYNVLKCR